MPPTQANPLSSRRDASQASRFFMAVVQNRHVSYRYDIVARRRPHVNVHSRRERMRDE